MVMRKEIFKLGDVYLDGFWASEGFWPMVFEMTVMGLCTPPYFDYTVSGNMNTGSYVYSYDSIIAIVSTARLYNIIKIGFFFIV